MERTIEDFVVRIPYVGTGRKWLGASVHELPTPLSERLRNRSHASNSSCRTKVNNYFH